MRVRPLMAPALPLLLAGFAACGSVQPDESDASTGADAPSAADALAGPDRDETADTGPIVVVDADGIPDATAGPDASTCDTCFELITGAGDFMTACPAALMLYEAWINCLCLPTTCGDVECAPECMGMTSPDPMVCSDCVNLVSMPGGACEAETNACLADM